jgi:azurin
MEIPQYIEDAGLDIDGIIWFRREVTIPANMVKGTTLSLGPIDDSDITYVNGVEVGSMASSFSSNRNYEIPDGVLKPGKNSIAVRVEDNGGEGGIYGNFWQLSLQSGESIVRIHGTWKYKVEKSFTNQEEKDATIFDMVRLLNKYYGGQTDTGKENNEEVVGSAKVVTIKTITNEMKFDVTQFSVKAGEQVELVLQNPDFMQHNLVITKPGKKEVVGKAADKMAADPNAATLNYVPQMSDVLFATPILNPDQTYSLKFKAPSTPGEYPYICTFPGHWRIMQGVMIVK